MSVSRVASSARRGLICRSRYKTPTACAGTDSRRRAARVSATRTKRIAGRRRRRHGPCGGRRGNGTGSCRRIVRPRGSQRLILFYIDVRHDRLPAAFQFTPRFPPGDRLFADQCVQLRLACSVGASPTGGKVRNLRSLGRIRGGNEADEADRRSHLWDGERVTGPQRK